MNVLRTACSWTAAGALAFVASAAWSDVPTLVPYPAPGGNSVSILGAGPAFPGGWTLTYTAFDPSAYGKLYYGIGDYTPGFVPGAPSLTFDGSTDVLGFNAGLSSLPGGVAVWTGTTNVFTLGGSQLVHTRFTLQVQDLASAPVALTAPASLGLPGALGGLLDVTGAYKALWSFEASYNPSGGFSAANSFFDNVSQKVPGYFARSSVGGAFYATPVPEPASAALLLAGLCCAALTGKLRRR
jgi:hypothetical protein